MDSRMARPVNFVSIRAIFVTPTVLGSCLFMRQSLNRNHYCRGEKISVSDGRLNETAVV